ncbi:hypothetical protein ES703_10850 [subsurface metagenome]
MIAQAQLLLQFDSYPSSISHFSDCTGPELISSQDMLREYRECNSDCNKNDFFVVHDGSFGDLYIRLFFDFVYELLILMLNTSLFSIDNTFDVPDCYFVPRIIKHVLRFTIFD